MTDDLQDGGMPHLALLHRRTDVSEATGVTNETSLYRSLVTGQYVLEQVVFGRHGRDRNAVCLGAEAVRGLLPWLERIASGRDRDEGG